METIAMTDESHWHFDKTINVPTFITVGGILLSGLWWGAGIQAQTNSNTAAIIELVQSDKEWKQTWAQFNIVRDGAVRSYEQRMTTQENLGREIMRRLDEIRNEQIRLQGRRDDQQRR